MLDRNNVFFLFLWSSSSVLRKLWEKRDEDRRLQHYHKITQRYPPKTLVSFIKMFRW